MISQPHNNFSWVGMDFNVTRLSKKNACSSSLNIALLNGILHSVEFV